MKIVFSGTFCVLFLLQYSMNHGAMKLRIKRTINDFNALTLDKTQKCQLGIDKWALLYYYEFLNL